MDTVKNLTRLGCHPTARIPIAAALLCLYWIALPAPLSRSSGELSTIECLTLADSRRGDHPGWIPALERCSRLLPADVELMADLGVAYEAAGQPDRAEAAYRRALAVDAEYADVRRRLAMLMLRRGATDEARRQVEAALLVQPNRAALRTLLEP